MQQTIRVLHLRLKDRYFLALREQARPVNFLWNCCKDFASLSDGHVVGAGRHYRKLQTELAKAQRAKKKARVQAFHAKIKNSQKDQLHKLSTALVEEYGAIFKENVDASALARTRMAKSVLDADWSSVSLD